MRFRVAFTIIILIGLCFLKINEVGSVELDGSADVASYPFISNYNMPYDVIVLKTDLCLSLLEKTNHAGSFVASVENGGRSPEKRAVASSLGLIFGIRFALGPEEVIRSGDNNNKRMRFDLWYHEEANMKALAVSDYRRCKKEEALMPLINWRWQR